MEHETHTYAMFIDKDYPLQDNFIACMLASKLKVDKDTVFVRMLIKKMIDHPNRVKSSQS